MGLDTVGPDARNRRFRNAIRTTYNAVGHDMGWVGFNDEAPDDDEFVDVMCDLIDVHGELSKEDRAAWHALSYAERRKLCLDVGP